MMGSDICWLVINLDRSPDRLAWITRQFEGLRLPFTRVPGIDGMTLPEPLPGIDRALFRTCHGRELRGTDAGSYLGHLRALAMFLATGHRYAVILEDDILLSRDAVRLVEMLTADGAPEDWDTVKLTGNGTIRQLNMRRLTDEFHLSVLWTRLPGAAGYLVNRRAAETYVERLLPIEVGFDHAFDRGWALGIKVRAITPFPATGLGTPPAKASTIGGPDRPKFKVKGWRKVPTLWWRAKTEVMRVVAAVYAMIAPTRPLPLFPLSPRMPGLFAAAEEALAVSSALTIPSAADLAAERAPVSEARCGQSAFNAGAGLPRRPWRIS
jgi:glycosyl transferase family 25